MDAPLKPAVAKILDELRARPKGTKKMSARRILRAFGFERRSHENVREICAQFQRARIQLTFTLDEPASLDEQVLLRLEDSARPPIHPPASPSHPGRLVEAGKPITAVIAAVKQCTVQVFTEVGGGSGVIVDADGLILTNRHVIEQEDGLSERSVQVTFPDGAQDTATVVRSHRPLDFALLVTPRRGLPAIPLGDPLQLGDAETIYAIGSPAGLTNSVSKGIVSAARRRCGTNVEYIQIDAAINPGNSGGPVVTEQGDLVGISSWGYRGGAAAAQGINFAIPVDYVADEIAALRQIGLEEACRRPYCRHCGWLHAAERRYCENCGAIFVENFLEGKGR